MTTVQEKTVTAAFARKLYELLPALYRIRDAELSRRLGRQDEDGPLNALLSILAEQGAVIADDLEQLYDDLFIETCSEWVVPYIGDLVGARMLYPFKRAKFSQRALVANTIANRRRKGTAAGLEQLARDASNWDASVVEYFQRLATTQYVKHVRLENHLMPELRRPHKKAESPLDYVNTPFDRVARLLEVRRIESRRGRYNIPNVGVFLWRLAAHRRTNVPPYAVDAHRSTFDALGRALPLVTRAESEEEVSHLAEPTNVPMPIARRILARQLETYYGHEETKSIGITLNGAPVDAQNVRCCNLSDLPSGDWAQPAGLHYLIDPELGRLMTPLTVGGADVVRVTYHHGFSDEMGSGEYARQDTFTPGLRPVIQVATPATIQSGLNALGGDGAVEVTSNDYFAEALTIRAGGRHVELRAADRIRPVAVLTADVIVFGEDESTVTINGFLMSGGAIRVPAFDALGRRNQLKLLRLRHCALPPGPSPAFLLPGGPVAAQPAGPRLVVELGDVAVEIDRSIVGPIQTVDGTRVSITNSIVDAGSTTGIAFAGLFDAALPPGSPTIGGTLDIVNSTAIGKVSALTVRLASNSIFLATLQRPVDPWPAPVMSERLQEGCVRYSYVPPGSRLPRRYKCQPAVADDDRRVRPVFTSLRYGHAGYGQLSQRTAVEIRTGADDQAEMGAFHDLSQPQRIGNVRARLDEFLRFGLEAGILLAT